MGGTWGRSRRLKCFRYLSRPFEKDDSPGAGAELVEIGGDERAIDNTRLAPWQKLDTIETLLSPLLFFTLRAGHIWIYDLIDLDRQFRFLAKSAFGVAHNASSIYVVAP